MTREGYKLARAKRRAVPQQRQYLARVYHDVGCIDGSDDCDGTTTYTVEIDGEDVTVDCNEVAVQLAEVSGGVVSAISDTGVFIAKALFMYGEDDLCACEPYLEEGYPVHVEKINHEWYVVFPHFQASTEECT